MVKIRKLIQEQDGAIIVLFALVMTLIAAFSAIVIDAGAVYAAKQNLQSAADAAALAGAKDLSVPDTAESIAITYAGKNGMKATENGVKKDGDTVTATTPYLDPVTGISDTSKIEVECKRTVSYTFARVLHFTEKEFTARAVAKNNSQWTGESLPFLNANNAFLTPGTKIEAWEKVDSGYFECIENFDIINNTAPYDELYFKTYIEQGLQIKNGTVANKKQEIGYYYNQNHEYVYILSFSPTAIATGKVILQDGSEESISNLKNKKSFVSLSSLVLVKCTFDSYDEKKKTLYLTSIKTYDVANNDFPPDYVNPEGGSSKLVE